MIVKCKDNGGLGDCPYRRFCIPPMIDKTITGCSLPFVWNGLAHESSAVVEHTVKEEKNDQRRDR